MKTITILTLSVFLALSSITFVWGSDTQKDDPQKIERRMLVKNEMGSLSDFTCIVGDSASTFVISTITTSDPRNLWLDLQILKNKGIRKLNIYIDSGGGNAFSGLSYASQLLAAWPDFHIITYAMGVVGSAAIPIFLAGEHRVALHSTLFMIHKGALRKPPSVESQADLKAQTRMMDLIEINYNTIITERSKLTLEELLEKAEKTTWFTAKQAQEWGMVEEIR